MSALQKKAIVLEVDIMRKLSHTNVVKCFDFYERPGQLLIVMELMTGGELFDRVAAKEKYDESEARKCIFDLFSALQHCHSQHVMHRGTSLIYMSGFIFGQQSDSKKINHLFDTIDRFETRKFTSGLNRRQRVCKTGRFRFGRLFNGAEERSSVRNTGIRSPRNIQQGAIWHCC